ncbi:MAG: 16S rRNA (cytosine(1402)-N(4))-methyltransferase RsmH [Myxococcaceae bacterium]|nr:16S rRNA (cytosine(1402)-N(4))-methyltransferase RsmH [Myxococcaceae bacterium]
MADFRHQTVLLTETVQLLEPKAGKLIIDGTLGGGGHTEALLDAGATVIGIDRDPNALDAAKARLARFGDRFTARQGDYASHLEPCDGFLLDLGVSSHQLDEATRGFSFQSDGPLDMRMAGEGETAAELIERLDENELADLIYELGEERHSRRIAKLLKETKPQTTFEAVESIKRAVPRKAWGSIHVATRTFQALRIAVNDELGQLKSVLERLPTTLKPGGVAAIISFHSLEDRLVKHAFRDTMEPLTKKPVVARDEETDQNPRARSAKLRAARRHPEGWVRPPELPRGFP